jgi:hypothetical protein
VRRLAMILITAAFVAVPAVAASAQTDREIDLLSDEAGALDGADAAEWETSLGEFETTLAAAKAEEPDLDYAALDSAVAALATAIEGGDLAEIETAAAMVADEADAVVAQADAVVAETDDGTAAPTGVATGSPVTTGGSNVSVLVFSAVLLMVLAGGALALRRPRVI